MGGDGQKESADLEGSHSYYHEGLWILSSRPRAGFCVLWGVSTQNRAPRWYVHDDLCYLPGGLLSFAPGGCVFLHVSVWLHSQIWSCCYLISVKVRWDGTQTSTRLYALSWKAPSTSLEINSPWLVPLEIYFQHFRECLWFHLIIILHTHSTHKTDGNFWCMLVSIMHTPFLSCWDMQSLLGVVT